MDCVVHFGGPDLEPRKLRDLLYERIEWAPPGAEIDWVTYYFRDRLLAQALLRARRRGVAVRVAIEGRPRTSHANDVVISMLAGSDGLRSGFRAIVHKRVPGRIHSTRAHLHEKLYCFSHPRPVAFVGSFNPSGDEPEEHPEVVREILDQDRGHNLLIEIGEIDVVRGLVAHAREIHRGPHPVLEHWRPRFTTALSASGFDVNFWPLRVRNPIRELLRGMGPRARVRIAASHITGSTAERLLLDLARRDVEVRVLTEETERRVPHEMFGRLERAGIDIKRVRHPQGLPMHNKFVLIERGDERQAVFGSFNWTERSFRLNHEISVLTSRADVFEPLAERWDILARAAGGKFEVEG